MKLPARGFLMFLGVFLLVYGGAHFYIWWRLVHPFGLDGTALWLMRLLFVALFVSFPLIHFAFRERDGSFITSAAFVSSVWMGMVIYFVLVTYCIDLVRLYFLSGGLSTNTMITSIVAIVVAITIYGLAEARAIGITNLNVAMPNLPAHLAGMKIAQISDVHMGLIVRGPRLEKIVSMINELNPDLIVITGDLVDAEALHMEDVVHPLMRLKSKHGIFAVPGNHEYFAGIERAQAFIEEAGVTMLRNRWVTIADGLQLVGRDDPISPRMTGEPVPSLAEIMEGTDRSKPTVLLYHTPDSTFEELQAQGVHLQLSGHTHKGQLWPFNLIVRTIFKTYYGRFSSGDTTIYVSRGTGTWGPPMRVLARPEITLITLRAKG
jgi:uncharacterized protein